MKQSFWLGISVILMLFFEYGYLIGLANFLPAEKFGLIGTAFSVLFILSTAITSGIVWSLAKFVSEEKENFERNSKLFSHTLIFVGVISVIIVLMALFFEIFFLPLTPYKDLQYHLIAITVGLPILCIVLVFRGFLQGIHKVSKYGFTETVQSFTKLILFLIFLRIGWDVFGAYVALWLGVSTALILGYTWTKKYFRFSKDVNFREETIKQLLLFSVPVAATIIGFSIFLKLNAIMLKLIINQNELVAYYIGAENIAKAFYYIIGALPVAILPNMSEAVKKFGKEFVREKFQLIFAVSVVLLMVFVIGTNFLSDFIMGLLYPPSYLYAASTFKLIAIGIMFLSLANVISVYLIALKETKHLILFTTIAVVTLIISNMALVPNLDIIGSAYSLIISSCVLFGLLGWKMLKLR